MNLLILSKENIRFAVEEVLALTKKDHELDDNLLLVDIKDFERLAYTKSVYKVLFVSDDKDIESKFKRYNWQKIYKKNFAFKSNVKKSDQKKLAGLIYHSLKGPKVDLKDPATKIELFRFKKRLICALLIKELKPDFGSRRPHLRPELHPTSLDPKLARAIINLTGIKKGKVLDPFCGSGGILIEAGLIGLRPVGYDVDQRMLIRSKINLDHFKIKDYELKKADAVKTKKRFNYIITDLPYGKNTKQKDIDNLYSSFIKNLEHILQKKAVIIFPDFYSYKKLFRSKKLKIIDEFDHYLHQSLSKKIVVVEKSS